jgi:hypothetical protein
LFGNGGKKINLKRKKRKQEKKIFHKKKKKKYTQALTDSKHRWAMLHIWVKKNRAHKKKYALVSSSTH